MTVPRVRGRKGEGRLVCVTAYDAPTAALVEAAGVEVILVGDSLGNVVLGYENTLPVTMDEMVHHLRAARRGTRRALLVGDLPFMSYQAGPADALRHAGRFLKEGADAVKLEGGLEVLPMVNAMVAQGIPVMGHVGLTPQRVREYGGYRAQGVTVAAAARIWQAAVALDRAGVFAIVLEAMPASLARRITAAVACPTIGIGAGPDCDGQILVFHDLVGLSPVPPPFARAWADGRRVFAKAVGRFARAVRGRGWPPRGRGAALPPGDLAALDRLIAGEAGRS